MRCRPLLALMCYISNEKKKSNSSYYILNVDSIIENFKEDIVYYYDIIEVSPLIILYNRKYCEERAYKYILNVV